METDEHGATPESLWRLAYMCSSALAEHLDATWARPTRHNLGIERLALWNAVKLYRVCEVAATGAAPSVTDEAIPVEVEYELEAAIRVIPAVLPFNGDEIDALLAATDEQDLLRSGAMLAMRQPALVDRWHRWLWGDSDRGNSDSAGNASLLAVATGRLAMALEGA